jgi:cell division protein FtsI (penicillin-binding protein 3)
MLPKKNETKKKEPVRGPKRFRFFLIITAAFIAVLLWQYVSVMLLKSKPESTSTLTKPIVERGPILDRNGKILAIQTKLSSVTAWTPHIEDPGKTAAILHGILGLDEEKILEEIQSNDGFLYIKRKISPTDAQKISAEKEAGNLAGISLEPDFGRNYPEKNLAAHILGYVGTDNTGLSGIEYSYDHELSPEPVESEQEIIFGNQIFLTIDLNVQHFADKIAQKAYEENDADSVMLLIAEAKTGDIIATVSKPDFDPNKFTDFSVSERQNRPVTFAYEPGSVFKIFSLAGILELGGVDLNDSFYCGGEYIIEIPGEKNEVIRDLRAHGTVTPQKIIKYSCNVGMAYASERVEREPFFSKLKDFGFGAPTGLPLPGETAGQLQRPGAWSIRSKPTIAFGQEISVSAVQVIAAATVLANNGMLLRPHIIKKIVAPDGTVIEEYGRDLLGRVVSSYTANELLLMMETATFTGGTASDLFIDGFRISAKTGTGQIIDRETRKYSETAFLASAIAIFPTQDPQYIVYTVIEHPKGEEYFGSRVAVPVVREAIQEMITYFRLPRRGDLIVRHPGKVEVTDKEQISASIGEPLPNMIGLSKRQILPLLDLEGIAVRIRGEGWVASQKPSPGTIIKKGMEIVLELE